MALPGDGKPAEKGPFRARKPRKPLNYNGIMFHYICSAMQHYLGLLVTLAPGNDVTGAASAAVIGPCDGFVRTVANMTLHARRPRA